MNEIWNRHCKSLHLSADLRLALIKRDERTRMKISFCKNYGLTGITMEEEPVVHLQEHFLVQLQVTELVQPWPHMQVSAQTRSTN